MKWGVRKDEKRAAKLSSKYGVKVGKGIKKKEVKAALSRAEKTKEFLRQDVINTYANNSTSYFADMKGSELSKMSKKDYDKLVKKTNDMLKEIDDMTVSEITVRTDNGKRYVEAKLDTKKG